MKPLFPFIFIFLLQFNFYSNDDLIKYFTGEEITGDSINEESNDCMCDITPKSCDYLCCCDEYCPENAIEDWDDHLKCLDKRDTIGIFADRCIDHNLVAFHNSRRGLKCDEQTEDTKTGKEIKNFCYSMDNSGKMTNEIITLDKLKDYGYNEITQDILDNIITKINNENNNNVRNLEEDQTEDKYIPYSNENQEKNVFNINNKLYLYSGSSCGLSQKIVKLKSENYSCYMKKNEIERTNLNIILGEKKCELNKYEIEDGLLNIEKKGNNECNQGTHRIREVEFIIKLNVLFSVESCSINFVCENNNESEGYIFKNSVKFIHDNEKIPYRYSGQGGYLNSFPLKIADESNVYNEYYITGKNKDNNCRIRDNIFNYLYDVDVPFNFKEDLIYSCTLSGSNPDFSSTVLYLKIRNIAYIARYGSASYENVKNSYDWINFGNYFEYKIRESGFPNNGKNYIMMNIYIGTEKTHKYIYNITINIKEDTTQENKFTFQVKYYDLKELIEINNKYNDNRPFPTIIPPLPQDILEPLIYSNVDK